MKRLTILLLSAVALTAFAQSTQRGLVQEYRGTEAKTPLSNVSITASNASAVKSDDQGVFTLNFRTLHAGDAIQFRRVELNGYEVMNTEALEVARIANTNDPSQTDSHAALTIVMAPKETLRKLRDGYRSVAVQRYEKQLQASEAEIERLKKEGQLAEEQYNERMNALEEEYENRLAKLETYIDKFARIDLSDLDQDEQQIIELVQAGRFEEALQKYDSQNLSERLRQSREDQQKLVSMRNQLAQAARQKAAENQRLRQSIDRQVTLLYMAGGEDNLKKVHELRYQVFLADTTHVQSRLEYVTSLLTFGMTDQAISVLKSGIASTTDSLGRGRLWAGMARSLYQVDKYRESLSSIRMADSLLYPLQDTCYKVRSRYMPTIYTFYVGNSELLTEAECSAVVDRCLQHWEPDTLDLESTEHYSVLLLALSDYFKYAENHAKAIWSADEGMRLGQIMQRRWPWLSTYWQASAAASSIFAYEGKRDEAVRSATTFVQLLQPYMKSWSKTAKVIEIVSRANAALETLVMLDEYQQADSLISMLDEWKVIQSVLTKYSGTMDEVIAQYKINASMVLLSQGRTAEAETMAAEALTRLAATEGGAVYIGYYRPGTMARIRAVQGRYQEAKTLYQEAIVQAATLEDNDMCSRYAVGLANVYKQMGDVKSARKTLKQASKYAVYEYNRQLINNIKL